MTAACTCRDCPNLKPVYSWDRTHRVIKQVRSGGITSTGAVIALMAELDQMSQAQRQRVRDDIGAELEALGVQ